MRTDKTVYKLIIEDLQNTAIEDIGRKLTNEEIKQVEEELGNFVDWSGAISATISYLNIK